MNITVLSGFIATDIELRNAGSAVVTTINLAVKDNYKKDLTHFIRVEAWQKTAELLNQYCQKGSKIGVEGSLKVDKFQDKEGNNREVVKVNASRIEFLDTKNNQSQGQKQEENPFDNADGPIDVSSDDLPF